jgi:hypothetical protein
MKNLYNWLRLAYLLTVVVVIMAGFSQVLPLPVLILAAVVLLGIPFVREFLPRQGVDERQRQISHFSSSMAFYAYLALLLTIIIEEYLSQNKHPGNTMLALLIIPLSIKFFVSLLQNFDPVQAARCIALFFAGSWIIFVLLSLGAFRGKLIASLPYLAVVIMAILARKWPRVCGIIILLIGLRAGFNLVLKQKSFSGTWMASTVWALPLILSGVALLLARSKVETH